MREIYSVVRAKGAEMTGKDTKMTTRRRFRRAEEILDGPAGCLAWNLLCKIKY